MGRRYRAPTLSELFLLLLYIESVIFHRTIRWENLFAKECRVHIIRDLMWLWLLIFLVTTGQRIERLKPLESKAFDRMMIVLSILSGIFLIIATNLD